MNSLVSGWELLESEHGKFAQKQNALSNTHDGGETFLPLQSRLKSGSFFTQFKLLSPSGADDFVLYLFIGFLIKENCAVRRSK